MKTLEKVARAVWGEGETEYDIEMRHTISAIIERDRREQAQFFDELLHAVGKLLRDEGEEWRLAHPELLGAYEATLAGRGPLDRCGVCGQPLEGHVADTEHEELVPNQIA